MNQSKLRENAGRILFMTAATVCVLSVIAIFAFLILNSIPALQKLGLRDFLFGDTWLPDRTDRYQSDRLSGTYGIFTMVVGTLAASAGALLFGGVIGYFTAVFLAFFCPQKWRALFSGMINLLAGIPSVVYGFFGIAFLLPLLSHIAPNNGSGLLATSLILGIMILPTVTSLSRIAMEAVPRTYYEGAVALGASHTKTVFGIMVPAARSGITASLILGVGRALGETMAVVMVAGNSPAYPNGLFGSFRVLTANIAMEMGYAGEVQEGALIATGAVLLVFVLLINLLFNGLQTKKEKKERIKSNAWITNFFPNTATIGKLFSVLSTFFTVISLFSCIGFIFVNGIPALVSLLPHFFGAFEFGSDRITILPSVIVTLMTVTASILLAIPIGVMTAVYLHEYTGKRNLFVKSIRGAIDILSGVPSIVYGLFGMIAFVPILGGSSSILAGTLTVSIMLLPTVVRSTEESLKTVSAGLREGSFALGAGKLRTVMRIVLPSAMPGILSAIILSIGRVVSESAPFLYTMGSVISAVPSGYLDSGATLAVALYQLSGEGWHFEEAYATAVVLILLVLGLNLFSEVIAGRLRKKFHP